tara:strand:- start:984 stop:1511 length:528 start_codon:yes stop_codon:yes gene_type:complete
MSDESNPNISANLEPEKDISVNPSSTEPNSEQKMEIAKWIADGMGLSDVQKRINQDFGIVMTYMDVRFLVDDLDLTLTDPTKPEPAKQDDDVSDSINEDPLPSGGSVQIEVDGVTPPGAMASGSVTFSDGESKKWTIDQFGRLGMTGGKSDYKPSDEDVMEFQQQLEKALRGPSL